MRFDMWSEIGREIVHAAGNALWKLLKWNCPAKRKIMELLKYSTALILQLISNCISCNFLWNWLWNHLWNQLYVTVWLISLLFHHHSSFCVVLHWLIDYLSSFKFLSMNLFYGLLPWNIKLLPFRFGFFLNLFPLLAGCASGVGAFLILTRTSWKDISESILQSVASPDGSCILITKDGSGRLAWKLAVASILTHFHGYFLQKTFCWVAMLFWL